MAFYTILLKDNNREKIPFLLNPIFITRLLISIAFFDSSKSDRRMAGHDA
jgi:hypothetical protein